MAGIKKGKMGTRWCSHYQTGKFKRNSLCIAWHAVSHKYLCIFEKKIHSAHKSRGRFQNMHPFCENCHHCHCRGCTSTSTVAFLTNCQLHTCCICKYARLLANKITPQNVGANNASKPQHSY